VHAKLLVTFVGTVVLLVVLGVLALRVLGESNDRVVTLGTVQRRATAYRDLQSNAAHLQRLLALRAGGVDVGVYVGGNPQLPPSGHSLLPIDQAIASELSPLLSATDPAQLGFVPPADEHDTLTKIASDFAQLNDVMKRIYGLDQASSPDEALRLQHLQAEPLAQNLGTLTAGLATSTEAATNALIDQNQGSFTDSQRLFIAVAAASIILALLLGYVLSWSFVGPIKQMEKRLAGIESGDFSGRVDVPNRDELGTLAANINHMNDELGRLYQELEAASRHKSEFLANMSHELRTPLNAIIGFSQVLREQMFGELNDKQTEYLDDILGSGQHLLTLINDILDLAKVEAGRMEIQPTLFVLPEVLRSSVAMVRERATRQDIELTTEIDDSVGEIDADERKLKQILFNLLSNAVKFTPDGGLVTLAARSIDGGVEISVSDTGVGISADEQTRIFEEFYQVGSGKTQEGTGLGLALSRRLVELHHGQLSVESSPGLGSTFTFTLPLVQSPPPDEEVPTLAREPVSS